MSVTATISSDSANAKRMTGAMNRSENPDYVLAGNANVAHQPDYYVSIFNVSEVEHRIERPWVSFNPAHRGKIIVIPAKEPGERYSRPFKIADIVQMPVPDIVSGEIRTIGQQGKFLAQDALNPEDPNGNWKTVRVRPATVAQNEGANLYHWGLFWTVNEKPSEEELTAAVQRMEANYNHLIEEAKLLYVMGGKKLMEIGNTHRRAAAYFGLQFPWNQTYTKQMKCPGCGTMMDQDAAICPKCPATFKWAVALQLGLRTLEQAVASGMSEEQTKSFFAGQVQEAPKRKKSAS